MKWSQEFSPNENCRYNHVVYKCPILGDVCILWKGWKKYDSYDCNVFNFDLETILSVSECSLDEAKNAVEEQYTALLKSALEKQND